MDRLTYGLISLMRYMAYLILPAKMNFLTCILWSISSSLKSILKSELLGWFRSIPVSFRNFFAPSLYPSTIKKFKTSLFINVFGIWISLSFLYQFLIVSSLFYCELLDSDLFIFIPN